MQDVLICNKGVHRESQTKPLRATRLTQRSINIHIRPGEVPILWSNARSGHLSICGRPHKVHRDLESPARPDNCENSGSTNGLRPQHGRQLIFVGDRLSVNSLDEVSNL